MSFRLRMAAICFGSVFAFSCSKDSSDDTPSHTPQDPRLELEGKLPETAPGTGCLQGLVIDARTGEKISAGPSKDAPGLFALIQSKRYFAEASSASSSNVTKGEYYICNIPLDETIPVYGYMEGYAPFESRIRIDSKVVIGSSSEKIETVAKTRPMAILNVAMHAFGKETDLPMKLTVTHRAQTLRGAQVRVQLQELPAPTAQGFRSTDVLRSPVISRTTDDGGKVEISAKELIFGARYRVAVEPSDVAILPNAAEFVFGKSDIQSSFQRDGFTGYLEMTSTSPKLMLISSNVRQGEIEASGSAVFLFNREIEIMPGTEDTITASLTGALLGTLKPNIPGNGISESVVINVEGNRLTLSPHFEKSPDARIDSKLKVTFSKIMLRAKGITNRIVNLELPAIEVQMFDAQPVPRIIQTVQMQVNASPSLRVGETYSIDVQVYDQFGLALSGQTVQCGNSVNGGSTQTTTTSNVGMASCTMNAGTVAGAITTWVKVAGETRESRINVGAGTAAKLLSISGANQTANAGKTLGAPIVLKITDTYGNIVGASVKFEARQADFGSVSASPVSTDGNGQASTTWTLGTYVGTQTLRASLESNPNVYTDIAATATRAPTP